jgi:hypothetical protein
MLTAFGVMIWVLADQALPEPPGVLRSSLGQMASCSARVNYMSCDPPVIDGGIVALFTVLISIGVAALIAALLAPQESATR